METSKIEQTEVKQTIAEHIKELGVKTMEKIKTTAFGKKVYLIGKDKEDTFYWLEEGKFDCGWYWGFGYVETYTRNECPSLARDINSHSHFDGMFLNGKNNGYDKFKNFFAKTVLTDGEIWKLVELMKSFYIARNYSDMLHSGGAHYTTNPAAEIIKSPTEYDRINKIVIPAIIEEVYKLLTPEQI